MVESVGDEVDLDGAAGVDDGLAAHDALGLLHGDASHGVVSQMLRDLQHEAHIVLLHLQCREDGWQLAFEPHIDDGADDLRNNAATGSSAHGVVHK